MVIAIVIGTFLVTTGALLHFVALRECARRINPELHPVRCFLFSVQVIILSHLFVAAIFAIAFHIGETSLDIGSLQKANNLDQPVSFMDRFYFSLVNYTTLGRGDLFPTKHLRLLTAMEAMLGFLVITGSGSFLLKIIFGQNQNLRG